MSRFLATFIFFAYSVSWAAIMPTRVIIEKAVEAAGTGPLIVEQDVVLGEGSQTITLKETWSIEGDDKMKVVVTSPQVKGAVFAAVYRGGQRQIAQGGQVSSGPGPTEPIEALHHFRSSQRMGALLIRMNLIPESAMTYRPTGVKSTQFVYKEEPFVRLARTNGIVAYALGSPSIGEEELSPGLWIEQDVFVVRKVRFPSGAVVTADQYSIIGKNTQFPKQREVRWNSNKALIQFKNAQAKPLAPNVFNSVEVSSFDNIQDALLKSFAEEFYLRFR